ncbi:flagellar protein FlaG [Salicibibacter cibarius]|uniref:Flagellar protein FlaG n=1 Tax=Salicibibacter cibarius TaxID=2743000 RepID=A0A7T6Z6W7_9BACI|nr:flagellar protein FlaG [Salicibibacter cibarius]QQK77901.1 flagellar protein FlaG [Salicibibacter cibarius]
MDSSPITSAGGGSTFPMQRFLSLANEHAQRIEKKHDRFGQKQMEDYVEEFNDILERTPTSLRFNIHEDLDRIYVHVVDRFSEEILREIPPEKLLDMTAAILKQAGIIVDEQW